MDDLASSDSTIEAAGATDEKRPAIWGLVATLLWTVLIAVVFLVAQVIAAGIYAIVTMRELPRARMEAALAGLQFDGTFVSFCTLATLFVCVPIIVGIAKLKRGSKVKDYLGLNVPGLRQTLLWSLITSVFCGLVGVILPLLHDKGSDFFLKVYGSVNPRWPLWLAVGVAAPVFEEIYFRGFLFKGLAASRLRWFGATVITSVLWAAVHVQYDLYEVSTIFAMGLILGTARAMTNSTLLAIWLHCLVNVLALAGTALALTQF
jgi:membrane protease YdiL (CAAX protease family)